VSTYIQMQQRIASDLMRDDLATQIAEAIQSAIKYYRYRPVVQSEGTLAAITSVVDQKAYTLPSDFIAPIQFTIDADGNITPLRMRSIQWIDEMDADSDDPISGTPSDCALYGEFTLHVYPRPDEATMTIGGRYVAAPAAPEDDEDETFWTTTAERAVRCRAVALLYDDTLHEIELADREYAKADNEWAELVRHMEMRDYASGIRAHG
jgi:hypothetical protein